MSKLDLVTPYVTYEEMLGWTPFVVPGSSGNAWTKILTRDLLGSGAQVQIIKFDAGWKQPAVSVGAYQDIVGLDGEFTLGGVPCKKWSYAYFPKGAQRGTIESKNGARVVMNTGGSDEKFYDKAIGPIDTEKMEWKKREGRKAWQREKILRGDPRGEEVLGKASIIKLPAGHENLTGPPNVDGYVEFSFCLDGEMWQYDENINGTIVNKQGCLIVRSVGYKHGPPMTVKKDTIMLTVIHPA